MSMFCEWDEIPENANIDYYIGGEYLKRNEIHFLFRGDSDAAEQLATKIIRENGNHCPVCGTELLTSAAGDTLVLDKDSNDLLCCENCLYKAEDKERWPVPEGWHPTDFDEVGEVHWCDGMR